MKVVTSQEVVHPRVILTQTRSQVLYSISEFLNANGINNKIHTQKLKAYKNGERSDLHIYKREHIQKFLGNILPYLIVKKTIAQDALRTMKLFPVTDIRKKEARRRKSLAN